MECPHILSECKINRELIKTRKCQLIDTNNSSNDHKQETSPPTAAATASPPSDSSVTTTVEEQKSTSTSSSQQHQQIQLLKWKCSDCQSSKDNWLCLHCGSVLCGRYDNGHALKHFQEVEHKVCINTLNFSVYCYQCDDFVVNETPTVEEIRQELKGEDDSCSETSYSSSSSTKSSQHQETASVSSTDSGWEDAPKPQQTTLPDEIEIVGRKLRPRKRTHSNEATASTPSSGNTKAPGVSPAAKRKKSGMKVVGLRNLGNTCFMNSVLQSLSNIKEFSHYFNALPSLESPGKAQRVYYSRSHKENSADANVVEELRKVLISLSRGGDGSKGISPECLFHVIWKVVPQFRGHRQHDAHEFLRYMLDRLHTELQHVEPVGGSDSPTLKNCNSGCGSPSSPLGSGIYNLKGGRSSIVTNVFGGTLQSEVRCLICGMESKKHDPFLDLSLDIPEKYYKDCNSGDQAKPPDCNISDCLSSFTEVIFLYLIFFLKFLNIFFQGRRTS
ncbi:USP3 family protein [Megaselia abdita]